MSDDPIPRYASTEVRPASASPTRTFLVLVDDTEEMRAALRFACLRARAVNGCIVLLRVIEPHDFQHFTFVTARMESDARDTAEKNLQRMAGEVQKISGRMPVLMVREGRVADAIVEAIEETPSISVLVLATGTGKEGPGPLVKGLASAFGTRLKVPVTVVPPHLSEEDIRRLT